MKRPRAIARALRTSAFVAAVGFVVPLDAQTLEFRTIDGHDNNPAHGSWGAAETPMVRITTCAYADGLSEPSGADRPGPRAISNAVHAQYASRPNAAGFTDYFWQWGQFLDHDITEAPLSDPPEAFDIPVPKGDYYFDPYETGTATIALTRSRRVAGPDGIGQQINDLTAFIDASNVYGSTEERARALRTNDGTGRLKTSDGDLLPYNLDGLPNAGGTDPELFLAGDLRANEQIYLTAMHTLWVREHNAWADVIYAQSRGRRVVGPGDVAVPIPGVTRDMTDDEIYELARCIVGAEMQVITYRDWLPVLVGEGMIPPYAGYRDDIDPGICNVFAAAAFRIGHTMLSPTLRRLGPDMEDHAAGSIGLQASFFAPWEITQNDGIDPLLRGLAGQAAQTIDPFVIDDVRNFLFGPPGTIGFDLASLNIQRARDHGLPGYNQIRRDYGLEPAVSFADITADPDRQAALSSVYADIEQVDPWTGFLCEDPMPGALVGETLQLILAEQFIALRDGDRFWYENHLPAELQAIVEEQTLAKVIRRNTEIGDELQDDVFFLPGGPTVGTEDDAEAPPRPTAETESLLPAVSERPRPQIEVRDRPDERARTVR